MNSQSPILQSLESRVLFSGTLPDTLDPNDLATVGLNRYFPLQPGYKQTFDGKEDGEQVHLVITVLRKTRVIDGVRTRIVREVEHHDGELVEISDNYFVMNKNTKDVYYFGEDVNTYENGVVADHEGSWRSGVDGAKFGLVMPGHIRTQSAFAQERAPDVAEDQAKYIRTDQTVTTAAGMFKNCLVVQETTPLEPGVVEYKQYAPGFGLVADGPVKLTRHTALAVDS